MEPIKKAMLFCGDRAYPTCDPLEVKFSERGNRLFHFLDHYCGIHLSAFAASYRALDKLFFQSASAVSRIGILCPGAIGDLLLLSGMINGIRRQLPNAHIDVISSRGNAPALRLLPDIDSSCSFPVTRPDLFIRHLRQQKYDILFDASQWSRLGNIICNFSKATRTVGFVTKGQNRDAGYDIKIRHSAQIHETDNFLALGKALWPGFSGKCRLKIPEKLCANYDCYGNEWIYCHMWPSGKSSWLKHWPEGHWRDLISVLLQNGFKIALTGGKKDARATEAFIESSFPGNSKVISIAGKTDLPDLAWLLARSAALVSVNTGIMHLGALAGTPTVGLHGPTNPLRWGPVGEQTASVLPRSGHNAYLNLGFEYPRGAKNNMLALPVEDVLMALERVTGISCNLDAWLRQDCN